ncbi:MAG: COG4315 family predicted lipoprotein [Rhodospirillaceae bacterium]
MRFLAGLSSALVLICGLAASAAEPREAYVKVAMPPGFQVVTTELDGAVFADARGQTLYTWPFRALRNGVTGDPEGKSTCENQKATTEGGFMSPYPPGLILPDVETRPSCAEMWPPALAADDAKPVGNWSVITRKDGRKQWAYDEHALYTSALDTAPGDVMGASTRLQKGETAVLRYPAAPPPDVPPGLEVASTVVGRMIVNAKGASVYSYDKDTATKSMCDGECARVWLPVLAPEFARGGGEWSIVERSPGVRQWAFRKKPRYTNITDTRPRSVEGGDIPGWHNVYTQRAPAPPADFTVHNTAAGAVLADKRGMTVYAYNCGDDAVDQLACDHPGASQAWRFAVCSGGDPAKCLERFPPVLASANAKSTSRTWTVIEIDPKTGHRATPGSSDALRVWAYRDRPVYTFSGDKEPGDFEADGLGEFRGNRHGYLAFWVRDDFYGRTD